MTIVCAVCGGPADRFRDVVRVVEMRVEVVCRRCARGGAVAAAPAGPTAPAGTVAPRARRGHADHPAAATAVASRSAARAIGLAAVGLAAVGAALGLALASIRSHEPAPPAPPAAASVAAPARPPTARARGRVAIIAEPGAAALDPDAPEAAGLLAILEGPWIHPLAGPFRELPARDTQRFGAYRPRDEFFNRYCGSGHCGVDLGELVGLPVLAARAGVVERASRQDLGREGKYLRLGHAGGVHTFYMHLDEVAPGLAEGSQVAAGQMLGTLGRTGVKNSGPHLHYMIMFEGPGGKEMFVDPEPFLVEGRLVEVDPLPAWARPSSR